MKIYNKPLKYTPLAAIISAILMPSHVFAADEIPAVDDASVEKIIVTGSRIKRKDFISSSPTVTVDAASMAEVGTTTVDSYLQQLPQFQPGQGSHSNNSSGGTIGQSTLNLRGLGPQRNLILMDGRRLQSANANGAVDMNSIPSIILGGVEVIGGGASATYGSDAMSGVVNLKTRTDVEGFEFQGQFNSPSGDGTSTKYAFAYGGEINNGQGNFLVAAEYLDRGGISIQDRDFFLEQVPSGFSPYSRITPGSTGSQAAIDALFATDAYGNLEPGTVSRFSFFSANNDGSVFAVSRGAPINYKGSTEAPFNVSESSFGYHPGFYNYVQSPLERSTVFAKADYQFDNEITAYAQAHYATTEAQNIGSQPVFAAPWNVFVPVTNPYLQANSDLSGLLASRNDPNQSVLYQVRLADAGPRTYNTKTDMTQLLGGIKGYVDEYDLSWDVHASFGQAKNTDFTTAGSMSISALQQLVDAPDGGDSLCAGGYQVFAGENTLSDECVAWASRTPENETTLQQTVLEAVVEGHLADLPAGEARFAVVANYRKNTYDFVPDIDIAANNLASLSATQATAGDISAKELAVELYIPLLADLPMVQSLNANLGYRYSDYNLSGGASTYKVEFDWRLVDTVLLRTGFQHALRAPNVEEYFNAGTQQITPTGAPETGAGDPCDYRHPNSSDQAIVDLCIATGLPASAIGRFRQPSNVAVTTTYGDPTLTPETADSVTFGAVFETGSEHDALKDLVVTLDYYSIEIEDAIAAVPAGQSLQKCFNLDGSNPTYSTDNFFCQQFERSSTGLFSYVNQPYLNLGGYKTSGVDIAVNWQMPIAAFDATSIAFSTNANYLNSFEVATFSDSPYQEHAGTISNATSFPEWKVVNALTLTMGDVSLTTRWRYTSSMKDSSIVTNPDGTTEGTPAYSYIDVSANVHINDNLSVRLGINNLSDKTPPVVGGALGVTNRGVYDSVGRTAFVSATAKF